MQSSKTFWKFVAGSFCLPSTGIQLNKVHQFLAI